MHALISHGAHLIPGGEAKQPPLTVWLDDILPEQDFAIGGSFFLFLAGCVWLDWQERPSFRVVFGRLVLGFCVMGIFAAYLPLCSVTMCLCSSEGTSWIDDLIWLVLCSVPLMVALRRVLHGVELDDSDRR